MQIIVAITGASGAAYAVRLIQALVERKCKVHVTISDAGARLLEHELGIASNLENFSVKSLLGKTTTRVVYYHHSHISAPIASGTFPVDAMVVIPCSMSTLAGIAAGLGSNLILRAADVTLKERRPLILVPRETPLGLIGLENMVRVTKAGACVLPAMPAFYNGPRTIQDMIDFVVGKALDQLHIQHDIFQRWGEKHP